ncbi:hypothetical protein BJ912DRAFT_1009432, partial [Pholiota molesta]
MFLSFPHPALLFSPLLVFSSLLSLSLAEFGTALLCASTRRWRSSSPVLISASHLRTPSHSMPRTDSGQRRATETYKI